MRRLIHPICKCKHGSHICDSRLPVVLTWYPGGVFQNFADLYGKSIVTKQRDNLDGTYDLFYTIPCSALVIPDETPTAGDLVCESTMAEAHAAAESGTSLEVALSQVAVVNCTHIHPQRIRSVLPYSHAHSL